MKYKGEEGEGEDRNITAINPSELIRRLSAASARILGISAWRDQEGAPS